MSQESYIYCLENTRNGKKYIGKHCGSDPNYFGSGVALKRAIQKHGKDCFTRTILEYCSESELNSREVYWISYYNTYLGAGYNLTPGGDGWTKGMRHDEETKSKISKAKKGNVVISEEQREKSKKALLEYYSKMTPEERSRIYGVGGRRAKGVSKGPFSDEHRSNLSKAQTGKKRKQTKEHRAKIGKARRKAVDMYNDRKEYVKTFQSMTEAALTIGGQISEISKSCNDGKTTVKGYLFQKRC